jgi:hypothetical protein
MTGDRASDACDAYAVEKDRLVGLISIGDAVKLDIAEIEMEAAATRQYTA